MSSTVLRDKIDRGEFILAPGIHDMIAAVIANKIGFDIVYGTGYWLTASAYGLPDAGIATYTQMVDRMATLKRTSNAALIADADTGYGGLLNVHHTVRGYEAAGVSGIQIEDQEFPKKCGHTPYKRVIPLSDMVEKIKVACEARTDARNTLIISPGGGLCQGRRGHHLRRGADHRGRDEQGLPGHRQADDGEHGGWRENADSARVNLEGDRLRARDLPRDHGLGGGGGDRAVSDGAEDRRDQPGSGSHAVRLPGVLQPDRLRGRLGVRPQMGQRAGRREVTS
jgi:hypothetical protein